ncbi:MAG: hypothetical protein QM796_11235 [Chthoniobacteraceae bacterium]
MNLTELKSALDAAGISERAYSFTSDGCGEVYRIASIHDLLGNGWEVYYSERGNKNRLLIFRSEAEACDEFLRWILGDSTTRCSAFPQSAERK